MSQAISNLENQLDIKLFDREKKSPKLTDAGQALLCEAKDVVGKMDGFKARARAMAEGVEPELSVVFDVVYPISALTAAVGMFHRKFASTALRLYVEALGGVVQAVQNGSCSIGVIGTLPAIPDGFIVRLCAMFPS